MLEVLLQGKALFHRDRAYIDFERVNLPTTYSFNGTITEAGSVKNAFTYTLKEGTKNRFIPIKVVSSSFSSAAGDSGP